MTTARGSSSFSAAKLRPHDSCLTSYIAMAAPAAQYKDRQFLAVIGDEVCLSTDPHLAGQGR